jgi:hypothetical protein
MKLCNVCRTKNVLAFKIKVTDFETYDLCLACGGENSIIEIDEDQFFESFEIENRLNAWKDEKYEC